MNAVVGHVCLMLEGVPLKHGWSHMSLEGSTPQGGLRAT